MSKTNQSRISLRSRRQGFTLVELIVVIAILGILAGIAIPVYSGYIKKANQAADNMLLSAVNTAVGAARAENGFATLSGAELVVTDKKITGLNPGTVTLDDSADTPSARIAAAFVTYFGDNATVALKYCDSADDFEFHADTQTFSIVGVSGGSGVTPLTWTDTYGNTISFTQEAVDAYIASSFNNTDAADWAATVDTLVGGVGGNAASLDALRNDTGFSAYLTAKGVDPDNDMDVATALVTFAADKISGLDAGEIADIVRNGGELNDQIAAIAAKMGGSTFANKAVSAALLFGMSAGYANTDAGLNDAGAQALYSSGISDLGSFTTYMNSLDQEKFHDYLASEQLTTDLNGFIGVLSMVDGNYDVLMQYLGNNYGEFNNTDLTDMLRAILAGEHD